MIMSIIKILPLLLLALLGGCQGQAPEPVGDCQPTPFDEIGPFYRPNAPVRARVGKGYVLKGTVRSVENCRALPGAMLEFWLVNEQGEYDEHHRATVLTDRKGRYKFESNRPVNYVGRLPHIHMRISAPDHETLITQHYPEKGESTARFDIVLERSDKGRD